MTLAIPDLDPGTDVIAAALAYARAGWYVLPVNRATKHPGSVLGKGWPAKSSRDPAQIAAWFAGSSDGLALHCGRSGAVVFDVDRPDLIPTELLDEIERAKPPMQTTRDGDERRGHYLFIQPEGRSIGNSGGKLGGTWGEVRGRNGIVVVAPTLHQKAAEGGRYRWVHTGPLPILGTTVAALLPDQTNPEDAVTDAEIEAFVARHTTAVRPELVEGVATSLRTAIEAGEGRHPSTVTAVCWALREAQAGLYSAHVVLAVLWPIFRDALRNEPSREPASEWRGIVSWAIGQAALDDSAATRERLTAEEPFGADAGDTPDAPRDPLDAMRAELLDTDGLDSIDDLTPLVKGVLSLDTIARVNGKSTHGKSFVVLDLSGHVGTGRAWHGHAVAQGEVIYLVAEGARGIRKRVRAWEKHYGVKMTGVRFLPRPVNVGSAQWSMLAQLMVEIRPVLIVIDTQARVTVGMNENDNSEMGMLVEHIERMRRATGACVLLVHHLGHAGEEGRGATSVKAALQTELLVERKERIVTLTNPKQKDDKDDLAVRFAMASIEVGHDADGYLVTSLVLLPETITTKVPVDWIQNATENQARILEVVAEHFPLVGGTKSEVRSTLKERFGEMKRTSFNRAWDSLVGKGYLTKNKGTARYVLASMQKLGTDDDKEGDANDL